jgi:glycosyltransferase involved in cell wall biosynthesis
LKAADILVVPSLSEGLPNVVLEAFAVEVPVVATDVGGNPELVIQGETGLIVPPSEGSRLAEAMEWMLRHEDETRAMAARALDLVRTRFNFETQAARLCELYSRVRTV